MNDPGPVSRGLGEWDNDTPLYDLAQAPVADHDDEPEEPQEPDEREEREEREEPIVSETVASLLAPARLDTLREAVSAVAETELNPPPAQTADPSKETAPRLYYGSVDEFVREFICPTFRRNIGQEGRADYRWSARWWQSAEAITRLEAIWRAWEHLRMDPATGTSVWLRDHADHHLGVLMSPTGPWALSQDTASPNEPLPYETPPKGLFPDMRDN